MKQILSSELETIINNADTSAAMRIALRKVFTQKAAKRAVLGFDIYRYSKYKDLEQSLIPYVFKHLYTVTVANCIKHESYVFTHFSKAEDFARQFIDTGDGGFQVFNTPLQGVIFALYFQANTKRFNAFGMHRHLRTVVGEITLRYALTLDQLFSFEQNFYGTAIINNARIMSKDKLNRFLIDDKANRWFEKHLNGIENLASIDIADFKEVPVFAKYPTVGRDSLIFSEDRDASQSGINAVHLLRIGELEAKDGVFSVHSAHLQALMNSGDKRKTLNQYTVTLGNLNSAGLT